MESYQITNQQKKENYREQFERLRKALQCGFYLEAVFIEYAIIEDRLESYLRHSYYCHKSENGIHKLSLEKKLFAVKNDRKNHSLKVQENFSDEVLQRITVWKNSRNDMTHELLKQHLHTIDLEQLACEGNEIARYLSQKVAGFGRLKINKSCKEQ